MTSATATEKDTKGDAAVLAREPSLIETVRNGSVVSAKLLESADADEALKIIADQEGVDLELDEAGEKRLLRRIDWHLMPLMCIVYGLNYLDKTTLSYASVMGMKTSLHLIGSDYQWLGSAFYFGYLVFEYPTSRLLQRLPLGKYSALNIVLWGTTLACFASVQNFGGALAVRILLGVFESAVTPGFALFTSQWYTAAEQASRTAIWFSFNGWAQILGGLVAYGIARGVAAHGSAIAPWRIVFLVFGLLTACLGLLFYFIMPDSPLSARWLSRADRARAIARIRRNQQGVGNRHWKIRQFREALTDPLTWLFVGYALIADIPNGGISNFFSQLIVSFGYTPLESLLYGTPGGAVEVVTILAWGFASTRYGHRIPIAACSLAIAIIGVILIVALPLGNDTGRLAGYYLTQASATPFVALLSLVSSNVAGYTKKTTVAALYLVGYCVGNIIGPQTFRPRDAPRYVPAEVVILVCWIVCLLDLAVIYWYCCRENRKKAALRAQPGYVRLENSEFMDLTDRENPEFVYSV